MKKLNLSIAKCCDCPYSYLTGETSYNPYYACEEHEGRIAGENRFYDAEIPEWCPLPNEGEEDGN